MTAVDVHAHVIVPELLREAAPSEAWRPAVSGRGADQRVTLGAKTISSAVDEFVDLDSILASLSRREVDRVVLSPWVPLLFYDIEPEEALERCRLQNAGLARMHRRRPARVHVFGAVPLQDPELAAGWAQHRMPIPGLYQTGGTTHPGGSVTGGPGRNAARVMLADLGRDLDDIVTATRPGRAAGPGAAGTERGPVPTG